MRALLIVAMLAGTASAEDYSLSTDLGTATVFRGVAVAGAVRAGHWRVRAGFLHQNIPQAFLEMDSRNKGWELTQDQGLASAEYFLGTGRSGWFVDATATVGRFAMTAPDGMHVTAVAPSLAPGAGYQWFPFHNGLYVEPWAFLIVPLPAVSGSETVNGETFHHPPVIPGAWVSVGYTF